MVQDKMVHLEAVKEQVLEQQELEHLDKEIMVVRQAEIVVVAAAVHLQQVLQAQKAVVDQVLEDLELHHQLLEHQSLMQAAVAEPIIMEQVVV
jgi:hypothetical protein